MRSPLIVGRGLAVFIGVGTLGNVVIRGVEEHFVVPDLLIAVALLVAAALPPAHAVPLLGVAFGMASGVFTVATFSYVARGEVGVPVTLFAVSCLAMAAVLTWRAASPGGDSAPAGRVTAASPS
ncbi:hypothetical protein [Streptomyces radicis]|uniref:Uncharacterized protein n=1 Tax=Streptomyces radicis TaxID=1750517 RepID=A0A3A9WE40_9ACTN|nr:hypothetical protein [Streptomyces radicis]RKN04307.1 hypothetical protein D7319_28655 [Streptomyces radicis]RKN14814.1 hypothetical protein D7318_28410 [Streptomyces radicis]